MQTEFADAVGRRHGLERGIEGSRATHQKVRQWYGQIMRPDPVLKFSPQDLQLRQGETLVECAARLNARIETELKPTFSAAKVSKSATSLAKSMASTTKALRRQHDQIIGLCTPVLRLHSVSPRAFDELMNQVAQQLHRLQREARIEREDIRAQSLARTASQDKDQLASRDKTAPGIIEPIPPAAPSPVAPASDFQPDFDGCVGLDR
jgi:cell division septum initiation protein DivIVA